jgi:ABC-type glycerol-3-phosphate transport system substrate-binding protein
MKKTILVLALATTLVACGGAATEVTTDSTAVATDTTAVVADTTAVGQEQTPAVEEVK